MTMYSARRLESLAPGDVSATEWSMLEQAIARLKPPAPRILVLWYAPDAIAPQQLPENERGLPLTQDRIARIVGLPRTTMLRHLEQARERIAWTLNEQVRSSA